MNSRQENFRMLVDKSDSKSTMSDHNTCRYVLGRMPRKAKCKWTTGKKAASFLLQWLELRWSLRRTQFSAKQAWTWECQIMCSQNHVAGKNSHNDRNWLKVSSPADCPLTPACHLDSWIALLCHSATKPRGHKPRLWDASTVSVDIYTEPHRVHSRQKLHPGSIETKDLAKQQKKTNKLQKCEAPAICPQFPTCFSSAL